MSSVAAVVDFGSGVIKAGWAGEDAPAAAFRALVGEPKHARIMAGGALSGGGGGDGGLVCGASAVAHAGLLRLWAPAGGRGGVARDVRGLAALLAHAFGPAALQARTRTRPWRRARLADPARAAATFALPRRSSAGIRRCAAAVADRAADGAGVRARGVGVAGL
jgi:hypothetical protein